MNERDYLRLKKQFADEYERKLQALELIWLESSGGKKPPKEQPEGASVSRGNSAAAVAEFVEQWDGKEFSAKQVEGWIKSAKGLSTNRTTIIHKLRRMVNDGIIELAERGSGKRASVFVVPVKDAKPKLVDDKEIESFREHLKATNVDPSAFKELLQRDYAASRISQLNRDQFEKLRDIFNGQSAPNTIDNNHTIVQS